MRSVSLTTLVTLIALLGFAGCDRSDQATNANGTAPPPGQPTANAIQNAADKTGDALNNAAHATGEAMGTAATRTADLAQQARASLTTTQPMSAAPDAADIRGGLATVINDAVGKDHFSSLVKDFSANSQARFGSTANQDFADIDGIVAQIQKDWNAKYGHDFKATAAAFNTDRLEIHQGPYIAPGVKVPGASESGIGTADADRDKAVVTLMPDSGTGSFVIPMEKEGILRSWKIDVPAGIDAQKLHENLSKALTTVKDSMTQWPADENAAYRIVGRQVLSAILNTQASM